jgi:2-polyprenyl-3-methyl-5-hydroxy-6-metoxy-1,4-benzoquinol methylase
MANVEQHYDQLLSDVYSWMAGGFDNAIARNTEFFAKHGIEPMRSKIALDLGAGCGFQSIPLARLGFAVTAIDSDRKLLDELQEHAEGLPIATVRDDLLRFEQYVRSGVELAVCMVDTIVHLESKQRVRMLFEKVLAALQDGGKLIVTFRDLSHELVELDRFIPVRSDGETVFTCFLEYEPATVKVHDLVYRKQKTGWTLHKSFYRKLRLSQQWVVEQLVEVGYTAVQAGAANGFVTVVAAK